jgi:hypothetical protein
LTKIVKFLAFFKIGMHPYLTGSLVIENLPLKLIVIDLKRKEVKEWIPKKPTEK